MATSNYAKRLLQPYEALKNWNGLDDQGRLIFRMEDCSPDNTRIASPSDSASSQATSVTYISIIGLIYPARELFGESGLKMEIRVPFEYPYQPPEVYMRVRIPHPNIEERNGRICNSQLILDRTWNGLSLIDVVKMIIKLMETPEEGSAVNLSMKRLYATNHPQYIEEIGQAINNNAAQQT